MPNIAHALPQIAHEHTFKGTVTPSFTEKDEFRVTPYDTPDNATVSRAGLKVRIAQHQYVSALEAEYAVGKRETVGVRLDEARRANPKSHMSNNIRFQRWQQVYMDKGDSAHDAHAKALRDLRNGRLQRENYGYSLIYSFPASIRKVVTKLQAGQSSVKAAKELRKARQHYADSLEARLNRELQPGGMKIKRIEPNDCADRMRALNTPDRINDLQQRLTAVYSEIKDRWEVPSQFA